MFVKSHDFVKFFVQMTILRCHVASAGSVIAEGHDASLCLSMVASAGSATALGGKCCQNLLHRSLSLSK